MGLTFIERGHVTCKMIKYFVKSAGLGVLDREFGGKEQQEKPRVREFRELWIASLRGLSVLMKIKKWKIINL